MLVDASKFVTFIKPCRVACKMRDDPSIVRLSILRRWEAYRGLREIHFGVLILSDIQETKEETFFDVVPSDTYHAIKLALAHDLVWSVKSKAIDYARTVDRWNQMLEHDQISIVQVEKMKSNNLDAPEFLGFNVTLMEYLLTCHRRGSNYYRLDGFEASRP